MSLAAPRTAALGSGADARDAIVDALRTVPTLTVYPSAPDNPGAWDAFVRWALTNYTGGRIGYLARPEFDVLVVLPAGYEPDTVEQGDSLLDLVVEAVWTVAVVEIAEPIRLELERRGVSVPALRVRVIPRLNTAAPERT